MGKIDPSAAEDVPHLGVEDRGICVQRLVHAVFLNQVVPIVRAGTEFNLRHVSAPREGRLSKEVKVFVLLPVRDLLAGRIKAVRFREFCETIGFLAL